MELYSDHRDLLFQNGSLTSATVSGPEPMLETETFRNMMDRQGNSCTSMQKPLENQILFSTYLLSTYSVLVQDLHAPTMNLLKFACQ